MRIIFVMFLLMPLLASASWEGKYRGMNAAVVSLTEYDVRDFAATSGNVLRLSMPLIPLIVPIDPDYEGERQFDPAAFVKLDYALYLCEKYLD